MDTDHIQNELKLASREMIGATKMRYQVFSGGKYRITFTKVLNLGGTLSQAELKKELDAIGLPAVKIAQATAKLIQRKLAKYTAQNVDFDVTPRVKNEYDVIIGRGIAVESSMYLDVDIDDPDFFILTGQKSDDAALQEFMESEFQDLRITKA